MEEASLECVSIKTKCTVILVVTKQNKTTRVSLTQSVFNDVHCVCVCCDVLCCGVCVVMCVLWCVCCDVL